MYHDLITVYVAQLSSSVGEITSVTYRWRFIQFSHFYSFDIHRLFTIPISFTVIQRSNLVQEF